MSRTALAWQVTNLSAASLTRDILWPRISGRLVVGSRSLYMERRRGAFRTLALAVCATSTACVAATGSNWLSAVNGTWSDASKWSTNPNYPNNGTPPATTYDAVIDAIGSAYVVTLNSNVTVDMLTLNSAN